MLLLGCGLFSVVRCDVCCSVFDVGWWLVVCGWRFGIWQLVVAVGDRCLLCVAMCLLLVVCVALCVVCCPLVVFDCFVMCVRSGA